jgi:AbrB family looped-hinge helix DNA binding protein
MTKVTISSKNQIVIPATVRKKLALKSGDGLILERVTDTEFVFKKEPSYSDLLGVLKPETIDATKRVRTIRDNWR